MLLRPFSRISPSNDESVWSVLRQLFLTYLPKSVIMRFLPLLLYVGLLSPSKGFPTGWTTRGVLSLRQSQQSRRLLFAKPKRGGVVDSYQTVSVNCAKCRTRLFRYKKKNGTKSNLVKCYIERIVEDSAGVLEKAGDDAPQDYPWKCPNCHVQFARSSLIHGRPALKMVGGKIRMTKK